MGLSRADWITVGVTLLLFALAYYINGPKLAVTCLSAGILILVITILRRRHKQERTQPPSPSQSVQQTANPVITQNPTQTVNVNIDAQARQAQEPPPDPPMPKLEPNIRFVEAKVIPATTGSGNTFHEAQARSGGFYVGIACFRNDGIVGKRLRQPHVKAHIVFRDAEGLEITDVPRAVWMDNSRDYVEFAIGHKRCLILFLLTEEGTLKRLWSERFFHEQSWMNRGPSFRQRDDVISEKIASIKVDLVSESTTIFQAILDVNWPDGQHPKLTQRKTAPPRRSLGFSPR